MKFFSFSLTDNLKLFASVYAIARSSHAEKLEKGVRKNFAKIAKIHFGLFFIKTEIGRKSITKQ